MSYEWNGQAILAPMTFRSNQTVWTVEKSDKSIDRRVNVPQRWELTFSVLTNENEADMFLSTVAAIGQKQTMIMPSLNSARLFNKGAAPTAVNQIKTVSSNPSGSSQINIKNTLLTSVKIGKATFVQFQNHNKIYAVKIGVTMAGNTSTKTLNIFPALVTTVPANTGVAIGDDVVLHYYLDDGMLQGINYVDGVLSSIDQVSLLEAI